MAYLIASFNTVSAVSPLFKDLAKVLVTEKKIQDRVRVLGTEISEAYREVDELTVIPIINGAIFFTADLVRRIDVPVRLDCMRVASYGQSTKSNGKPKIVDMLRLDLKGRHVLIIDDILDTGNTISKVVAELKKLKPASLRLAVLLEKQGRREVDITADFVGFRIPDEFVVGYGLDFAEQYRQLPCIGVLKPDCQNPPVWQ